MATEHFQTVSQDLVHQLINFGGPTITPELAILQLHGTTAVYNKLVSQKGKVKVGYLADEVGMGKTYIALGVLALMRHFRPNMRVVVIAPRKHMQTKWIRDQRNFIRNNYQLDDLSVRNDNGSPARPFRECSNLVDFAHRSVMEHDHDFILRMSSFSLAVSASDESGDESRRGSKQRYEDLIHAVLGKRALNGLQWGKQAAAAKRRVGQAVNQLLRPIDLLIVDEAHNLKHGIGENVAFRNQVLQEVFANKVEHVLLMSATPVESSYRELFNQLEVFGAGENYAVFADDGAERDDQKRKAKEMLVRRVYALQTESGERYTRNQYRREWRGGGVAVHDEGMSVERSSERLVMGLMQLKVQEALGKTKYPHSFQMGLLASFESYGQTVANKDATLFQPEDGRSRADADMEGADVGTINGITQRYRQRFGRELPHPKMDAVRDQLNSSWESGEKALVFVRRIASATELVNRLNEYHDEWLLQRLKALLPKHKTELDLAFKEFTAVKKRMVSATRTQDDGNDGAKNTDDMDDETSLVLPVDEEDDEDFTSFFSWFFRSTRARKKDSKPTIRTGGWLQTALNSTSSSMSTIFLSNDVADLLECSPKEIGAELSKASGMAHDQVTADLRNRLDASLPKDAERYETFLQVQAAALRFVMDHVQEALTRERAKALYDLKYQRYEVPEKRRWNARTASAQERRGRKTRITNAIDLLAEETLWTRIRASDESVFEPFGTVLRVTVDQQQLLQREVARELMTGALRRSHAAIDLYGVVLRHYRSLRITKAERQKDVDGQRVVRDLSAHLAKTHSGPYSAIHELLDIAKNIQTIIDLNVDITASENDPVRRIRKVIGALIRNITPSADMTGGAPDRLIKQFRLPGYPFVLVATDVISEGQDLHTFCRNVYHYGVAWMPSGMEQRTGRIDRVNSRTERHLKALSTEVLPEQMLQVYLPYLKDTIEVVQVHRVLTRMNAFLEALHDDLQLEVGGEGRRIDLEEAMSMDLTMPPQYRSALHSTFDIDADSDLAGIRSSLRLDADRIDRRKKALRRIIDEVSHGDEILKRDGGYISARRVVVTHEEHRAQNYRCQVSENHGITTIICKSLAAYVPIEYARDILEMELPDGIRVMDGDQPDTERFDCWVVGELYIDVEAIDKSIEAVNKLIDDVVHVADAIEHDILDGDDLDEDEVQQYDGGGYEA